MILLNTTILSNFALVSKLALLRDVLGDLSPATTSQVMAEFKQGIKKSFFPEADMSWIKVVKLSRQEAQLLKRYNEFLGKGEASCLAVAKERGVPLATDDAKTRSTAQRLGVTITGTLGILLQAVQQRLIPLDEGNQILAAMREQGYFSPVTSLKELLELE